MPKLLTLNSDQEKAYDDTLNFLFTDADTKCISGGSGTGKSVLIAYIFQNIIARYTQVSLLAGIDPIIFKVVVLATTNSAALALQEKLKGISIVEVRTVHSFFGLVIEDNLDTGTTSVNYDRINKGYAGQSPTSVERNTLVIIDEASQLDGTLKLMIMGHLDTSTCKLLLIGDKRQLLPVKGTMTTAFYQANVSNLTRIERANSPELTALYTQLADTVDNRIFSPIKGHSGIIDWLSEDDATAELTKTFIDVNTSAKVATYTDARAREICSFVRHIRGQEDEILVGDNLMVNTGIPGVLPVGVMVNVTAISESRLYKTDVCTLEYKEVQLKGSRTIRGGSVNAITTYVPVNAAKYLDWLKYFASIKNWKSYFTLKKTFMDLRLPVAMTTYKLQGLTVDTIFVDMSDLGSCRNPDTFARLQYVALTRAAKRIVLFGELPDKYKGLLANKV